MLVIEVICSWKKKISILLTVFYISFNMYGIALCYCVFRSSKGCKTGEGETAIWEHMNILPFIQKLNGKEGFLIPC